MDIRFTKGQFVTLRAAKKVHLGSLARDIEEGDMVEYDGQTLRHFHYTVLDHTCRKIA